MIFPDGTSAPWCPSNLPLDDTVLYTVQDIEAMANYMREQEDKRILTEVKNRLFKK